MSFQKLGIPLAILVFLTCCMANTNAISHKIFIPEKVARSSLIAIGTVTERQPLWRKPNGDIQHYKISEKAFFVPLPEWVGTIITVTIKEVLLGKETAPKVLIFPRGGLEYYFYGQQGKTYLLFLKEVEIDKKIAAEFNLQNKKCYNTVAGNQGALALPDEKKAKLTDRERKNSEYVQAVKTFCEVKKIKDEEQRTRRWQELTQSDNRILRNNAEIELRNSELIRKAKDKRPSVRKDAIFLLMNYINYPDNDMIALLSDIATNDHSKGVRTVAQAALQKFTVIRNWESTQNTK